MVKKLLSLTLVFGLLLSFAVLPSAQGAELLSDLEEMNMLVELGIINAPEDDKLQVVDTLERGDFAIMLATILTGGGIISSGAEGSVFTDVAADTEEGQAIALVVEKEIMSGYGDGTFRPDISITYQDVLTCLVRFLGAGNMAVSKGGYPMGYINQAGEMGLTKNVKCDYTSYLNYTGISTVLCNLLEAPVMSLSYDTNASGQPYYYMNEENTVLTEYFKVYQDKGIMTANEKTSLDSNRSIMGTVTINGVDYNIGETNAGQYLGYYVKFYYKQEYKSGERTVISIRADEKKNSVLEVLAEDVEELTLLDRTREMRLKYLEDENSARLETAKISKKVYVIKNDVAFMNYKITDLVPTMGSVTLIDNDNDGVYDVMKISDYEIMLVGQASASFETITDKYKMKNGAPYKIILDYTNEEIEIKSNGKEMALGDIKTFDVLTVYKSEGRFKDKIVIEVTRNKIEGFVENFNEEDKTMKINGQIYYVNPYFINYLKETGKTVPVGSNNTFYLDKDGKIAGTKENVVRGEYGFFRKIYENDGGMGTGVRVYDVKANKWNTYELADKVSIDSSTYTEDAARSVLKADVYRYELNADGEIRKIYTPVDAFGGFVSMKKNVMINGFARNDAQHYYHNGATAFLKIPEDEESFNNELAYLNSFSMTDREWYNVKVLDLDGFNMGMMVWSTPFAGSEESYGPAGYIVKEVSTAVNEDNVVVGSVKLIGEWGESTYTLSEDCTDGEVYKNLKKGDMIRIGRDGNDVVTTMTVDVSSEELKTTDSAVGNIYMWYGHYAGTITYIDVDKGIFAVNVNGDECAFRIPGKVIVNKDDGKEIFVGNGNDIQVGQKAVFRIQEGTGRFMQIFG